MSARDFAFYTSTTGSQNSMARPITASQSFLEGEPVTVVAAGTLSECLTDPADVAGIAAMRSTDVDGTAHPVGTLITLHAGAADQIFKTTSITSDGAGATTLVPTLANIGDLAGFALTGGVWSLDTGTNNLLCEITGVLDRDGRNLSDPNLLPGAGSIVLFRFVSA